MKLSEYLDIENLDDLIRNGYVSMRPHKDYPEYNVLNYTPLAAHTFSQDKWTDALKKSRGLIIRGDDRHSDVVSFGLHKFFNVSSDAVFDGKVWAFDKLDGSLGIIYRTPNDKIQIATRGSFHSEQADWANKFLENHSDYVEYFDRVLHSFPDATPHVEIIYKENQIVLDYDFEDLVYLGYQTPDFWRPGHHGYPGRRAQNYSFDSFAELVATERPNREGFVILDISTMQLTKYKYEKYLELHRAVSNLSPKYIWEQMVSDTVREFIEELPNEFHAEADRMHDELLSEFNRVRDQVDADYADIKQILNGFIRTKKDFAMLAVKREHSNLLFSKYEGNNGKLREGILKAIKP